MRTKGEAQVSLVYLAGPITGMDYSGATDWREAAISELAQAGIRGLSPMRAKSYLRDQGVLGAGCYGHLNALSSARGITTRDHFDTTRCDVLLVNLLGATKPSLGTVMEIAWAHTRHTPIVVAMEPAGNPHEHAMICEAIGFRVRTLPEALEIVKAILATPSTGARDG